MADDEQHDGQGQNQGAMSSTPSRAPGMQNNRRGGGGPCVGECIRQPKIPELGIKDLSDPRFGTMIFAEVLGTFFLVFIGCGSCRSYSPDPQASPVMVAFAFGVTVASIAQAIGHVSGAHLNPAVSFGLMVSGQCSLLKACCYSVAQIFGSVLANFILWITTQTNYSYKTGDKLKTPWELAMSTPSVPPFEAIIIEMLLTFLLVLTVCGVCDDLRKDVKGAAPLAIGLTVFVCHVMGIQFTGSSINPARSIDPLVFEDKMFGDNRKEAAKHLYIYIIGPMLGGVLAGAVYQLFFREKESGSSDSRSVAPAK